MLWMQCCREVTCVRRYFAHTDSMPLRFLHVPVIHTRVLSQSKTGGEEAGDNHYRQLELLQLSKLLKRLLAYSAGCLLPVRHCHAPMTQCYVQTLQHRLPRQAEAAQALLAPDPATSAGKPGLARHCPAVACGQCDLSFDRRMLTRSCCMWARKRRSLGCVP